MLSEQQKNDLLSLIVLFVGNDPSIAARKSAFNSRTVYAVERMIEANIDCNGNIKDLVSNLVSGGRSLSRGWLKHALGGAKEIIQRSELNGYGCLVVAKSNWKTEILYSVY
ncbi:hypothetical protein SAMN05216578_1072 [Halopseudomonas formosensis]|uniref:Uncharacterized protein n=1 Tax=Halopseudomonas formosensis TaxID=1002526 RepID=A0A1I6BVD0_9GAMM|nr:hypothetical protein [Halopseudomonas formosensis]SFQ84879.1 hypothetical protein SAMN05216578_1072 [Halopseudomonas formosensis]